MFYSFFDSPERHNIIWCGRLVRRRSCLPLNLYNRLAVQVPVVDEQEIDANLSDALYNVVDAVSLLCPEYDEKNTDTLVDVT